MKEEYSNDSYQIIPVINVIQRDHTHSRRHNKSTVAPAPHKYTIHLSNQRSIRHKFEDWNYRRIPSEHEPKTMRVFPLDCIQDADDC